MRQYRGSCIAVCHTRYRKVVLTSLSRCMSVGHQPTRYRMVVLTSSAGCTSVSYQPTRTPNSLYKLAPQYLQ